MKKLFTLLFASLLAQCSPVVAQTVTVKKASDLTQVSSPDGTALMLLNDSSGLAAPKVITVGNFKLSMFPSQSGNAGKVLATDGSNLSWQSIASGTVTSVGLVLPSDILTVSGSPVTSTGTLTAVAANQPANTVWAGPTTGSAATPGFRSLVTADLPSGIVTTSGSYSDPSWITALAGSKLTGAYSSSGLTLSTARILGRYSAGSGAVQELSLGTGLTTPSGVLTLATSLQAIGANSGSVSAGSVAFTVASLNGLTVTSSTGTLTVANGKTLTANNSVALSGTDGASLNLDNAVVTTGSYADPAWITSFPWSRLSGFTQKIRISDRQIVSNTTLADDDVLTSFSLAANKSYRIHLKLIFFNQSGTPGMAYALTFSGTNSFRSDRSVAGNFGNVLFFSTAGTGSTLLNFSGTDDTRIEDAYVTLNTTTSGTLDFQWAQDVSSSDYSALCTGSLISVEELP